MFKFEFKFELLLLLLPLLVRERLMLLSVPGPEPFERPPVGDLVGVMTDDDNNSFDSTNATDF